MIALFFCALYLLYCFGLDRVGIVPPDEPRYAAIGRSMAESGDWVTPRLWGEPWFEKPALLYWMVALGCKLGLNPDLAPRVPVAAVSVAFLIFFFWFLQREYGRREALYSTAILATSAGWLTFSHIAVTDLPLSVCFSVAMLLVLPGAQRSRPLIAGIFLGLAVLAKGLVPFILFLPAVWFLRKRSWQPIAVSLAVAAPWYALVMAYNGRSFVDEFFWKHHFERFTTGSLQHIQPVWFYIPVLLAAIFPWTPLVALLFRKDLYNSQRARFLMEWLLLGLLFFSASENKLPGYLLPLLPPLSVLLGTALAKTERGRAGPLLGLAAALLWCVPIIADALPEALANGVSHSTIHLSPYLVFFGVLTGAAIWFISRKNVVIPVALVSTGVVIGALYIMVESFPALDRTVSARDFWRTHQSITCIDEGTRSWRYALNYYAQRDVRECKPGE